ncbi:unnamed protein product, partial [Timema podura]|nr:unnamed protein product [Timema podura]
KNLITLQSLLFNFLLLQLRLHNPRGAKEGDAAAYAYNWQTWSKHCQSLYTLVETEIRKLQHVTSNPKNMRLSANFLQLAVAVCKQVFESERNVLEVTQLDILNETVDELMLESMPKRRKVEVGLEVIMDILQSSNKPLVILPWYQEHFL